MATFLDIGLLQHFQVIFPFIFVFATVFAILEFIKPFGKETDTGIHSLIAICIAGMLLFSPQMIEMINFMAPWFVLLLIFILFILMMFRFAGTPEKSVIAVMSKWDTLHWFILIFGIIVIVAAMGKVYGPGLLSLSSNGTAAQNIANATPKSPETFGENVWAVLFHPKVVGMLFILLIASFTIRIMAGGEKGA
jgi:hypothetical protein